MNDYIDGLIVSTSCDYEIKKRNTKPFQWKRCNSKKIVFRKLGKLGHQFDYCKKHAPKEGTINGL